MGGVELYVYYMYFVLVCTCIGGASIVHGIYNVLMMSVWMLIGVDLCRQLLMQIQACFPKVDRLPWHVGPCEQISVCIERVLYQVSFSRIKSIAVCSSTSRLYL